MASVDGKIYENISTIIALAGNNKCADCNVDIDRNNGWASVTFGSVICVECAGVHRGIAGNQIRSFFLDDKSWKTDKNVSFFRSVGGNDNVNTNVWECHLPLFYINPKHDTFKNDTKRTVLRDFFIKSKYANQLFIPLSSQEYTDTQRNPSISKMPISPIQTSLMYVATQKNNLKWSKKPQYLLLHSFFLSIYSLNKLKRNKCDHLQTFNLISLKLVIDNGDMSDKSAENDDSQWGGGGDYDDFDDCDEYTFTITPNDHSEPILKCKCANFDVFIKYVHQIRKTILYYNMYSKLIDIDKKKKAIDLTLNYQYFVKQKQFIGIGKLFGGKNSYFYVFQNKLFTFHSNPIDEKRNDKSTVTQAKRAYDMQKIDIIPDINGERSGFKYALLLIEPYKMIPIKFETQQTALTFYSKLHESYTQIRGSYLVDFKYKIPIIVDVEDDSESDQSKHNTPGQLQDISDQNNELSRFRLKSLSNIKTTDIIEILSQMKANNSEQKSDGIDEDESKANDINNSMILRMKEMAEKMSKEMQIKQQKSKDNKPLLLKLHMSDKTYVTVPIHKHTKCVDVINKVIKRKNIDTNTTNVQLYHSDTEMKDESVSIYQILESEPNNHNIEIKCIARDMNESKEKPKSDIILIKLFIDKQQHITVPIQPNTLQSKVIAKVIKRRNIDTAKVKCILYFEERELTDEDKLYEIISGDHQNIHKIRIELFDLDSDGNIIPKPQNQENIEQKHQKQLPSQILSVNSDGINIDSLYEDNGMLLSDDNSNTNTSSASKSPKSPRSLQQSVSNPAEHYMAQTQASKPKDWSCTQCTFLNDINEDFCRICGCPKKDNSAEKRSIDSQMSANAQNAPPMSANDMQNNQMMMAYHFSEYQKVFGQLQYAQQSNLSTQQVSNLKVMGNYHFQQYQMMYELIKIQHEMNMLHGQNVNNTHSVSVSSNNSGNNGNNANGGMVPHPPNVPMNRTMQYLKLERYFLMNGQQKQMLLSNFGQIQDSLKKYGSISVVNELQEFGISDCFRLIIPSDIPLPQRKTYWQNILKISRENIGMCQEHLM